MKYLLFVAAIATVFAFLPGCSSRARSVDVQLSAAVHDVAQNEPGMYYVATTADEVIASFSVGYADVGAQTPYTDQTPMYIYSLTKIFTAFLVMQQVERSVIDLDTEVKEYLPWVPYPGTVRHFLSHSAGVPDPIWGTFYIHDSAAHASVDQDALLKEVVAKHARPKFEPGTDVLYSNLGYAILGRLVAETTGLPWHQLVNENILQPLGMMNTGIAPAERTGLSNSYVTRSLITRVVMGAAIPWLTFSREGDYRRLSPDYYFDFPAHGGLITTGADMQLFSRAVLGSDRRLLTASGWEQWMTPQAVAREEYALGWRVETGDYGRELYHTGGAMGHSAQLRIYQDQGVATFVQTNLLDSKKAVRSTRPVLDHVVLSQNVGE
jgi:CubicO group peptidase (beta-lactamase class C family)